MDDFIYDLQPDRFHITDIASVALHGLWRFSLAASESVEFALDTVTKHRLAITEEREFFADAGMEIERLISPQE